MPTAGRLGTAVFFLQLRAFGLLTGIDLQERVASGFQDLKYQGYCSKANRHGSRKANHTSSNPISSAKCLAPLSRIYVQLSSLAITDSFERLLLNRVQLVNTALSAGTSLDREAVRHTSKGTSAATSLGSGVGLDPVQGHDLGKAKNCSNYSRFSSRLWLNMSTEKNLPPEFHFVACVTLQEDVENKPHSLSESWGLTST